MKRTDDRATVESDLVDSRCDLNEGPVDVMLGDLKSLMRRR